MANDAGHGRCLIVRDGPLGTGSPAPWLAFFAALGLEIAAMELLGLSEGMRAALMVAAYPVGALFLAANWQLPWPGLACRCTSPGSRTRPSWSAPRLAFLGDVFFIPVSWPLSNVFSVGDVLVALGIVWALHRICQSRLAPSRQHS